jgi:hypothetical protein
MRYFNPTILFALQFSKIVLPAVNSQLLEISHLLERTTQSKMVNLGIAIIIFNVRYLILNESFSRVSGNDICSRWLDAKFESVNLIFSFLSSVMLISSANEEKFCNC